MTNILIKNIPFRSFGQVMYVSVLSHIPFLLQKLRSFE